MNKFASYNNKLITNFLLLLTATYFFSILFIEIYLLSNATELYQVDSILPDEALILGSNFENNFFHFSSGYGPFFWLNLKFFSFLSHENYILVVRIFFIFIKYVSFILIFLQLYKLKKTLLYAIFFLLTALITPGFLFFGKIISPEYLLIFLSSAYIIFLIRDNYTLGKYYLLALTTCLLLIFTKFSMAPLLFFTFVYTFFSVFANERRYWISFLITFKYFLITSLFCLPILYLCGFEESFREIQLIFQIQSVRNDLNLSSFIFYDAVTWDLIMVRGIGHDFYYLLFSFLLFFIFLKSSFNLTNLKNNFLGLYFIFFSLCLTINYYIHGLNFGWYLFVPTLFSIVGSFLLIFNKKYTYNLFISLSIFSFTFFGYQSFYDKINYKINVNKIFSENQNDINQVLNNLVTHYDFDANIYLDFLIPYDNSHFQTKPVRLVMQDISKSSYAKPDNIVINSYLSNIEKSPLINYVLKDDFMNFKKIYEKGNLIGYKRISNDD